MDPVFATMLDVVRIVTLQPTAPRETPRIARWADEGVSEEPTPGPAPIVKRGPMRLREWLRDSFMPR